METAIDEKLIPQNFRLGISLSILSILQTVYDFWIRCVRGERINFEHHRILFLINIILGTWILLFERKYFKNFSANKAIKWLDICVVLPFILGIVIILQHYNVLNKVLVAFAPLILYIVYCYALIRLGNSIRLIQHDFIGLLKILGIFIIISSIAIPLSIVAIYTHSNLITLLFYAIWIPPLVIQIIIYCRAIAFTKTIGN